MTTPNEEANETSSQGALASNAKNDRGADIGAGLISPSVSR